eukprot:GHVQ01002641.1.p1 GENE.GHVQ01002641.1~~GHVQ01002641.1.p1  ORF type:complete len:1497 (+),score=298.21 GHVQ01002641.1:272-4762(+)
MEETTSMPPHINEATAFVLTSLSSSTSSSLTSPHKAQTASTPSPSLSPQPFASHTDACSAPCSHSPTPSTSVFTSCPSSSSSQSTSIPCSPISIQTTPSLTPELPSSVSLDTSLISIRHPLSATASMLPVVSLRSDSVLPDVVSSAMLEGGDSEGAGTHPTSSSLETLSWVGQRGASDVEFVGETPVSGAVDQATRCTSVVSGVGGHDGGAYAEDVESRNCCLLSGGSNISLSHGCTDVADQRNCHSSSTSNAGCSSSCTVTSASDSSSSFCRSCPTSSSAFSSSYTSSSSSSTDFCCTPSSQHDTAPRNENTQHTDVSTRGGDSCSNNSTSSSTWSCSSSSSSVCNTDASSNGSSNPGTTTDDHSNTVLSSTGMNNAKSDHDEHDSIITSASMHTSFTCSSSSSWQCLHNSNLLLQESPATQSSAPSHSETPTTNVTATTASTDPTLSPAPSPAADTLLSCTFIESTLTGNVGTTPIAAASLLSSFSSPHTPDTTTTSPDTVRPPNIPADPPARTDSCQTPVDMRSTASTTSDATTDSLTVESKSSAELPQTANVDSQGSAGPSANAHTLSAQCKGVGVVYDASLEESQDGGSLGKTEADSGESDVGADESGRGTGGEVGEGGIVMGDGGGGMFLSEECGEPERAEERVNKLALNLRRVKLYEVDGETGNWIDKGTGHFCVTNVGHDCRLRVYTEDTGNESVLVDSSIGNNKDYSHQKDSIITWQEGSNPDLFRALSFQNSEGCAAAWQYVMNCVPDLIGVEEDEEDLGIEMFENPTRGNIDRIVEQLDQFLGHQQFLETVTLDVCNRKFLRQLFKTQDQCLQDGDVESLKKISYFLRRLVVHFHYCWEIFTAFLSDEFFVHFLRSCEYDKDMLSQNIQLKHVDFFANRVTFHEVLPGAEDWTRQVHFMYRITYVRDVCLIRYLDEQLLARMNQMLMGSMMEIVKMLVKDSGVYFETLKQRLRENVTAAMLLRDLLSAVKPIQNPQSVERHGLLQNMRLHNILEELIGYIDGTAPAVARWNDFIDSANAKTAKFYDNLPKTMSEWEKQQHRPDPLVAEKTPFPSSLCIATEILTLTCEQDPTILRHAIFRNTAQRSDGCPYFWLLLCNVLEESEIEGIQTQVKDMFVKLVNTKEVIVPERDEIGTFFYDKGVMERLVAILAKPHHDPQLSESKRCSLHFAKTQVMEILAVCAKEHRHRFKRRAYLDKLPARVMQCAVKPIFDNALAIAAVKCLRACVALKDTYVEKHLKQYRVMRPVVWMLKYAVWPTRHRGEGSLLESVCMELLKFVEEQNMRSLILVMLEDNDTRRWLEDLQKQDMLVANSKIYGHLLEKYRMAVGGGGAAGDWGGGNQSVCGWRAAATTQPALSRSGRPIRHNPNSLARDFDEDYQYFEASDEDDEDMQVDTTLASSDGGEGVDVGGGGGDSVVGEGVIDSPGSLDYLSGISIPAAGPTTAADWKKDEPQQHSQPAALVEGYEDDEDMFNETAEATDNSLTA